MALLSGGDAGVPGVAQHEHVEVREPAAVPERGDHRLQSRHDAPRILVVGRHQERGRRRRSWQRTARRDPEAEPAMRQQRGEPRERTREGERDPGEQHDEQHHHEHPERRHHDTVQDLVHRERRERGEQDRAPDHDEAPDRDTGGRGRRPGRPGRPLAKDLRRHRERRLLGQRAPARIRVSHGGVQR